MKLPYNLSKLDIIKLGLPFCWGVACLISFLYYASKKETDSIYLPLISCIAAFLLVADIWYYYRSAPGYQRLNVGTSKRDKLIVNFKIFLCFCLIIFSGISLMFYFDLQRTGDIAWGVMTIFFAMIWGVLTIKYQAYNENNENSNQISVPLSSDNEVLETEV